MNDIYDHSLAPNERYEIWRGFTIEFDAGDPDRVLVKATAVPEPPRLFLRVGIARISGE